MTSSPASEAVGRLAIVVPAYKARFLGATLASISAQTDQRFQLYVCDDGSPEDLETIFRAAALPADRATFYRFEQNIGGRSVVESWRRSIARTSEPWVWMFSDDDLMEPGCVAAFHRSLEQDGPEAFNVYRFDTLIIDADGTILRLNPPHPARETVGDYLYHRLNDFRRTFAPDHIFRRTAFDAGGGFVEFPYALGSDDATWMTTAGAKGFRTLEGARVYWRDSGVNVSAMTRASYGGKLGGFVEYIAWVLAHPEFQPTLPPGVATAFTMRELALGWFFDRVRHTPFVLGPSEVKRLAATVSARFGLTAGKARRRLWVAILRGKLERSWRAVRGRVM